MHNARDRNVGFYIAPGSFLVVEGYSDTASLVVRFAGYHRKADGEIHNITIDLTPTNDRVVTRKTQVMGEGFLLSLTAYLLTGSVRRGELYVRAYIRSNEGGEDVPIAVLLAGYVNVEYSPSFPFGHQETTLDGPGYLRLDIGSAPAVGTKATLYSPNNVRWRILGVRATLVTDGTAGNRLVRMEATDGATIYGAYPAQVLQAASLTYQYSFGAIGVAPATNATYQIVAIPPDLLLPRGGGVELQVDNIKAGDQWSTVHYGVEEWMEH